MRFTDKTLDEIKASTNARMGTAALKRRKRANLYRTNQQLLRKECMTTVNCARLAISMRRNDQAIQAFIGGGKHGKLIFLLDPLGLSTVSLRKSHS